MSEAITACENICRDFAWLGEWVPALIASVTALLLGLVVYPQQKRFDRRLEIYKNLIDSSVEVIALANELRKVVDNACMDIERLKSLPKDKEFSRIVTQFDRRIIEFQILAPSEMFDVVNELRSALGSYRHVPIQRLQRWEGDSHAYSGDTKEETEEHIEQTCNRLLLEFAHQVQKHLYPMIGSLRAKDPSEFKAKG